METLAEQLIDHRYTEYREALAFGKKIHKIVKGLKMHRAQLNAKGQLVLTFYAPGFKIQVTSLSKPMKADSLYKHEIRVDIDSRKAKRFHVGDPSAILQWFHTEWDDYAAIQAGHKKDEAVNVLERE